MFSLNILIFPVRLLVDYLYGHFGRTTIEIRLDGRRL